MLQVLVCVKVEFACVELKKYARHRPNIRFFVPAVVLEDDFRRPVLSSVDYQSVLFEAKSGAPKVNDFDTAGVRPEPFSFPTVIRLRTLVYHIFILYLLKRLEGRFAYYRYLRGVSHKCRFITR